MKHRLEMSDCFAELRSELIISILEQRQLTEMTLLCFYC